MSQMTAVMNQQMGSLVNLLADGTALDTSFQQQYATGSTAVAVLQWDQAVVVPGDAGAGGSDTSGTSGKDPNRAKTLIGGAVAFGGLGVLVALGVTVYFIRQRRQWSQQGIIQPSVLKSKGKATAAAAAAAVYGTKHGRSRAGLSGGSGPALVPMGSMPRGGTPAGDEGDTSALVPAKHSKDRTRSHAAIQDFDSWWQQQQRVQQQQQQPPAGEAEAEEEPDEAYSNNTGGKSTSPIESLVSPTPVTPRVTRQGPGTRRSAWLVDSLHSSAAVAPGQGGTSHPQPSGVTHTTHRVAWAAGVTDGSPGGGPKRQMRRNLSAAVIRDDQLLEVLGQSHRLRAVPLVG
jgi:hypothetical protein